jgi:rhodanese-related sulfurtransferase
MGSYNRVNPGGKMPKKRNRSKSAAGSHKRGQDRRPNRTGLWIGAGIVLAAVAAFLFLSPKNTLPPEISVAQAFEKYQQGAFFLDVRTQAEWDEGHLTRSVLIPLDELQNGLVELPRDQEIVVICRSGNRSKEGAEILRAAGFTRVTSVNGGLQAWVAADYPVEE